MLTEKSSGWIIWVSDIISMGNNGWKWTKWCASPDGQLTFGKGLHENPPTKCMAVTNFMKFSKIPLSRELPNCGTCHSAGTRWTAATLTSLILKLFRLIRARGFLAKSFGSHRRQTRTYLLQVSHHAGLCEGPTNFHLESSWGATDSRSPIPIFTTEPSPVCMMSIVKSFVKSFKGLVLSVKGDRRMAWLG